jgi:hypothetical protein
MGEAPAQAAVVEPAAVAPVGRRELAALVGALAGLAATGCAAYGEGEEPTEELAHIAEALSGTALAWVDTVLGAGRTGDLATKNSANLGNAVVVIAKGCVTAGDGGGGIFYWEASATGDNGGTFIRPTAGAGRWVRIYSGPLDVRWFGASTTNADNSGQIQHAINAAGAAGGGTVYVPPGTYVTTARNLLPNVMLAGAGPTQSVLQLKNDANEPILYTSGQDKCGIRDLGFDGNNANQSGGAYQPVKFNNCNDLHIENVFINRGTDVSKGTFGAAAGLYITTCLRFRVLNVEVTGNGPGDGIQIRESAKFELVNPYVHDMAYKLVGATNDQIEGINVEVCAEWTLVNPRVHDIRGDYGMGITTRFSRGIQTSHARNFSILGGNIARVDQGIDLTGGDEGNTRWTVANVIVQDCYTWGIKAANSARDGTVSDCIAERCGLAGFVASGPSGGIMPIKSADIDFVGCTAYDCGESGAHFDPPTTSGFLVMNHPGVPSDVNTTRGIRFIGCRAIDREGNMDYGFWTTVDSAAASDGRYVECIDCVSVGHTVAALSGIHAPHCEVGLAETQSIDADDEWTPVNWTTDVDHGAMHDTVTNNSNVYARRAGTYTAQFGVVFVANGTGQRGARILLNGAVVPGTTVLTWPGAGGQTSVFTSTIRRLSAGDNLRLEVFQDSGGALKLQTTSGGVVEQVA